MRTVRREYFSFVNGFRDQVFTQFLDQVKNYETNFQKKNKMDLFLELYGRWLETKNPALKKDIIAVAEDLKQLDPNFHFDPERELYGRDDEKKCA